MQIALPFKAPKKNKTYAFLAFLICFVLRLIINAFVPSMQIMPDEFGAIANGAALAGLDWTNSMGSYFGMGFSFLYTPLFWWVKNISIQYYCIQAICALLQSLPALLCFRLMQLYGVANQWYCFGISIALSFLTAARANTANNESAMIFMTWFIVYCICYATHPDVSQKSRNIYTVLLCFGAGFALLAHTRAFVFAAGILVVVLFFLIFQQKWIVNPIILLVFLLGFVLCFNWLVGNIQASFYPTPAEGEVLKNSSASFAGQVHDAIYKLRPRNIKTFFTFLFTNLFALSTYSGLTITLGGLWGFYLLFKVLIAFFAPLKENKTSLRTKNWALRSTKAFDHKNMEMLPAILFCLFCLVGTLAAHIITWMPADPNEAFTPIYILRGYFYLRYFLPYAVPLVMFLAIFFTQREEYTNTLFKVSLGVFFGVRTAVYFLFLPVTERMNAITFDSLHYMAPFSFNTFGQLLKSTSFFLVVGFALLCFFIIWQAYRKKKLALFVVVLCIYGMYQYTYTAIVFDRQDAINYYRQIDASVEVIPELVKPGSMVYTSLDSYTGYINLQYWLQEYKVQKTIPDAQAEQAVVLCNNTSLKKWAIENGYSYTTLDGNETLYLKGEEVLENARAQGHVIYPAQLTIILPGQLHLTDSGRVVEETAIVQPGATQYGPYYSMPAGSYTVTVSGQNLDLGEFLATALSGTYNFEIEIEKLTSNTCIYTFTLEQELVDDYLLSIAPVEEEVVEEDMEGDEEADEEEEDEDIIVEYETLPGVEFLTINTTAKLIEITQITVEYTS